jgi:hypothetical protein
VRRSEARALEAAWSDVQHQRVLPGSSGVTSKYEGSGRTVRSREHDHCGYDLHSMRGRQERPVEVKGTSGPTLSVFMTRKEMSCVDDDAKFVLAVVRNALRKHPTVEEWPGKAFQGIFTIDPIAYQVVGQG